MFSELSGVQRVLMEVDLMPVQGARFQPTGFPDIGAATYQLPDGTRMLLVESAQSMGNRLESTILGADNELVPDLSGLSYIRVKLNGASETATNSLIEAHRINSPFIISDESFQQEFLNTSGYGRGRPLNWQRISNALFKYDVNSLLHGVFLANLEDGRVKVARSLTAFIEASNVREVVSGGVKNNPIDPTGKMRAEKYDKDVYGNVPYQRTEYTAGSIMAYFNLDIGLLRSYDLGQDAFELLVYLGLYKVKAFLDQGTRLRTACDLKCQGELKVKEPEGFSIPAKEDLLDRLKERISRCKSLFASPPVTEIETRTVWKKKAKDTEDE